MLGRIPRCRSFGYRQHRPAAGGRCRRRPIGKSDSPEAPDFAQVCAGDQVRQSGDVLRGVQPADAAIGAALILGGRSTARPR